MTTLSEEKIKSLLSLPGNDKCLECNNSTVEWVSFPTSIFLCQSCSREHKSFTNKETIKSLSIDEFTEKELSKISIGGNDRFLSILKEYNISLTNPDIENKYLTFATAYYNALLDAEINKNNNIPGAEETLNLLISKKPSLEVGPKLMGDSVDYYKELVDSVSNNSNNNSGFGGFFSFLGNHIYEYGIKEKMEKGVNYAKSAGEYIVDKGKEIANTDIVKGAVSKVKDGVNNVKDQAINMINNINHIGLPNDNIEGNQNGNPPSNLDFLNGENNNIYQQLSHDQM